MRRQLLCCLMVLGVPALALLACTARAPSATRAPTAVPTASQVLAETPTFMADQAAAGEQRFATSCRACHANRFSTTDLKRYETAQGLYDFLKTRMPPGNPDAIPEPDRYDVVAYLLVKAGLIKADQPVNATTAPTLALQ